MSFIGNMLGIGQGGQYAPKLPDLTTAATGEQAQSAYDTTQGGLAQQKAFLDALQAQGGIANQSSVFNQLQGVANGTGPNPAQAMLNQATGANVANQGALMASQRGAGANPALIARQAAQQGAATQQQAAGQGATLQANQSLNALNQLGGVAQQQVGNQANAANAYTQSALGNQGTVNNAIGQQNATRANAIGSVNAANVPLAQQNANAVGGVFNGLSSALGMGGSAKALASAAPRMLAAEGGAIPNLKENYGGYSGKSGVGRHLFGSIAMAKGGKVPALVSPGERYLSPDEVKKVEKGQKPAIKAGEKIHGKPKVGGAKDSYANDTVPKTLEAGGIVIPRSITQGKDAEKKAHAFVSAILARGNKK